MKTLRFINTGTVNLSVLLLASVVMPSCGGEQSAGTGLEAGGLAEMGDVGGSAGSGSGAAGNSASNGGVGGEAGGAESQGGAEPDPGSGGSDTANALGGMGGGGAGAIGAGGALSAEGGSGGGAMSAEGGSGGGAMSAEGGSGGGAMSAEGGSGGGAMSAEGGSGGAQGGQGGVPANVGAGGMGGGGMANEGGGGAGSSGEASMGGAGMGGEPGLGLGGSASCDQSPAPSDVSAWVDESWDAQLGNNIRSRKAWLLDSVMLGGGQINLCVRWGASSAPTAAAKTQIASSVENWFNDWFKALGNYDCFPYGQGIQSKITGWAVRPGNESWVSDLGPDVKIYTETDGEGEPKCADACSFFENWSHEFPNCPGGEAFHTDFWIWVNDRLPGGGAAAVGGDWGLRMPVAAFLNSLGKDGDNVIEHEMGHGFGFQDYYEWNGSRPAGGSLMIVGSQRGGSPTVGDTWLLRRTWSEMRVLRGW